MAKVAARKHYARRSVAIAAALVTGMITGTPALAASCSALRAELARASSGDGQSAEHRKWAQAAKQQKKALGLAKRDARHLGCASAPKQGSCPSLTKKIKRMESNLAKIERQRDRHASPSANRRTADLKRALARQGCNNRQQQAERPQGGGLLALFGIGRRDVSSTATAQPLNDGRSRVRITPRDMTRPTPRASGPTYRTMCVRTCDGFYFPVSFSTTQKSFTRDAAVCRSMCPGSDAVLFVHRNPGETADDLVSLDGLPYVNLPNANVFRTKFVSGCTCQPSDGDGRTMASLIRSGDTSVAENLRDTKPATSGIGLSALRDSLADTPPSRAPEGADPDTRLNVDLGYAAQTNRPTLPVLGGDTDTTTAAVSDRPARPQPIEPVPAPDRDVRIVGPRYFVAQ